MKLGVNIDHVATLRQARYALMPKAGGREPSPLEAAREAEAGGADSITVHLRADRRHIQDDDVVLLRRAIGTKLNLEMGNTPEILDIALHVKPDFVCLVPENRAEITTEGGLDAAARRKELAPTVGKLQDAGIRVSLFIDPDPRQTDAVAGLGAEMIELHTGALANAWDHEAAREHELGSLIAAAEAAHESGLQVNAGHGITAVNLAGIRRIPHLAELNIGHHIVSRAVFIGLRAAVAEMRAAMHAS